MTPLVSEILERNENWSEACVEHDPEFFRRLANGQAPRCLWIGCADSRVPVTKIAGFEPGEVFVHRNIANLVLPRDSNALSVLQYAVEVLKVSDVIVCGHTGCGGIAGAARGEVEGNIRGWLSELIQMARDLPKLEGESEDARLLRLAELNVAAQVQHISDTSVVRQARASGRKLRIQGLMYDMEIGRLRAVEASL